MMNKKHQSAFTRGFVIGLNGVELNRGLKFGQITLTLLFHVHLIRKVHKRFINVDVFFGGRLYIFDIVVLCELFSFFYGYLSFVFEVTFASH